MAPRLINYDDSIDYIWEEAVYTEARLLADTRATDLAPRMGTILTMIGAVRGGQYDVWRAEIVAQAGVDAADEHLDETVESTGKALDRAVDNEHDDPRWHRYVGNSTIKKIKAQALEAELKTVRTWPESLATEPEKSLQKQSPLLADALARGDAAIAGRTTAAGRRRDFMARDKAKLVDTFNNVRLDLHADLTKRVAAHGLERAWADGFFRKGSAKSAAATPDAPPQPA